MFLVLVFMVCVCPLLSDKHDTVVSSEEFLLKENADVFK